MFLFTMAFGAMLLSIVLWLQDDWGWSALRTGLGVAPGPVMVPLFSFPVAGRLIARLGPAGSRRRVQRSGRPGHRPGRDYPRVLGQLRRRRRVTCPPDGDRGFVPATRHRLGLIRQVGMAMVAVLVATAHVPDQSVCGLSRQE